MNRFNFMAFIFAVFAFLVGCASSVPPKTAIDEELRIQMDEFRCAVVNKNAVNSMQ